MPSEEPERPGARAGLWMSMVDFWEGYLKPLLPPSAQKEMGSMESLIYHGFLESIRSWARRRFRGRARRGFQAVVRERLKETYESWLRVDGSLPYSLEEATSEGLRILDEAWKSASKAEKEREAGKPKGIPRPPIRHSRLPFSFLPVRRDLSERLSKDAGRKGLVLKSVVNEALELAIVAVKEGLSPRELLEAYRSISVQREFGISGIPQELLEGLLGRLPGEGVREVLGEWRGSGERFGAFLRAKGIRDPKDTLLRALRYGLLGIGEASLSEPEPEKLEVRCIALTHGRETMELLAAFIEGFFSSLGYETIRKECLKRALVLGFAKV